MFRATLLVLASVVAILCTGCASIVSGQNQTLSVTTLSEGADVEGAKCQLDNDKGSWFVATPGSVTVRRSFRDLQVSCTLAGHETALQPTKSATKGMLAGNLLFGGAIGLGVDMSTGAAYDYPNLIVVSLTRAASAAGAVPGGTGTHAPVPVAYVSPIRAGTRLTFAEKDVRSGVLTGETILVLSEVTATQRVFNEGAIVTSIDGTPLKGAAHSAVLYGLGPRELAQGRTWTARIRAGALTEDAPTTVSFLRKQVKVISGQRFEATRVRIEGYASRAGLAGGSSENGAFFEGEALIDNATGIVLEMNVTSRSGSYQINRELVRVTLAS